jgi:catalase
MLGHLLLIDQALHGTVADSLGMPGQAETLIPAVQPRDLPPSPCLSIINRYPMILKGRKAGILLTDGFDPALSASIQAALIKEKMAVALIAPKIGGATSSNGVLLEVDFALPAGPSFFFDTVILLPSAQGAELPVTEAAAVNWVRDAFAHLKVIGHVAEAFPLLKAASMASDEGIVTLSDKKSLAAFLKIARKGRRWEREPALRSIG